MAMKMNRRVFLKTAAAAALAVSVSGMMTGCSGGSGGGGSTPEVVKITLGEFEVSVTKLNIWRNEEVGQPVNDYSFKPSVTIKYNGDGFTAVQFKDVFKATVGGSELKLKNGGTLIAKADIPFMGSKTYVPEFSADGDVYSAVNGGVNFRLKVTLQGQTAEFTISSTGAITVRRA